MMHIRVRRPNKARKNADALRGDLMNHIGDGDDGGVVHIRGGWNGRRGERELGVLSHCSSRRSG